MENWQFAHVQIDLLMRSLIPFLNKSSQRAGIVLRSKTKPSRLWRENRLANDSRNLHGFLVFAYIYVSLLFWFFLFYFGGGRGFCFFFFLFFFFFFFFLEFTSSGAFAAFPNWCILNEDLIFWWKPSEVRKNCCDILCISSNYHHFFIQLPV